MEELLLRRLAAIAADTRPLIHPPPVSPVDPGPHEEEPAVPRWRWWNRARTAWRSRNEKPKD